MKKTEQKMENKPPALTYTKYMTMTRCWRMYMYRYLMYLEPEETPREIFLGKAFHKAIEGQEIDVPEEDPLRSEVLKTCIIASKVINSIPEIFKHEVHCQKFIDGVLLEGTMDGISTDTIWEFKYTKKPAHYGNAWPTQFQAAFYHWLSDLKTIKFVAVQRPPEKAPVEEIASEDYKPVFQIEEYGYIDNEDWYRALWEEVSEQYDVLQHKTNIFNAIKDPLSLTYRNYFYRMFPRNGGACYSPGQCPYLEICITDRITDRYKTVPEEDREK